MALEIETKIKYVAEIRFQAGQSVYPGSLFHRRDYYDNGEHDDFYGIGINKDHFMDLKEDAVRKGKLR